MKKFLCYDTNDVASGKIEVDSRGVLKPNSTVPSTNGEPYKSLVTDGEGNVKWEDRLAYEKRRVVVDVGAAGSLIKVADEVPSLVIADKPATIYFDPEGNFDGVVSQFGNTLLGVIRNRVPMVLMALTDNCDIGGGVLPEKGVYFFNNPECHINRCVIGGTLEFTWDGSLYAPKRIDEKFIPKTNPLILYVFVDGLALKNNDKREPVHATVEEIRQAFLGAGVYTTPATDDVGTLGSLSQVIYFDPASATIGTKGGTYTTSAPS